MRDDHYGWFEKIARGVYALTPRGAEGLTQFDCPQTGDAPPD
jgi:hypothetical protein